MKQNNFENKVQQKLEELNIPPSDGVWKNVEKHIAPKKKRRKPILFFFLLLLIAVGGYWIFTPQTHSKIEPTQSFSKNANNIPQARDPESSSTQGTASTSAKPDKKNEGNEATSNNNKPSNPKIANAEIAVNTNKGLRLKKKMNTDAYPNTRSVQSKEFEMDNQQPVSKTSYYFNQLTITPATTFIDMKPGKTLPVSKAILTRKKEMTDGKLVGKIKKLSQENMKNKWKFGITVSGGSSWTEKNPDPINNNNSSASSNYNDPNFGLSSIPNTYVTLLSIQNSWAFIGGVFAERKISRKASLSFGLSYKYYSLVFTSGSEKYSFFNQSSNLSRGFYSSMGKKISKRNNFHFLEIPASIKYRLLNSKTLPISLSGGIIVSQLISSNALQFSPQQGIYSGDNSLFNKTQLALQTGISTTLFPRSKHPVELGPYFIYNVSKLSTGGLYNGNHFGFIGIKTQILLGNK